MPTKYRIPKDERDVEAEVRKLTKSVIRRQCLMREMLIKYEYHVIAKLRLEETLEALKTFQEERRRNSLNGFNHSPASVAKRSLT